MKRFFIYFVFLVILVGDLTGELFVIKWMDYVFKPFILIWIAGFFLMHSKNIDRPVKVLALWGFFFSWLGDVLLIFPHLSEWFFIAGLVSFLTAQIFYAFLFLKTIQLSGKKAFLKRRPFWLILYIGYGLIIYIALFEHLSGVMVFGVLLYMIAILSMSAMALNRLGNGHPLSFSYVFAGSLLFVLSDTLIALNKFVEPIPYEGIFVMTTYISAQYLIMRGILKQYEKE